MTTDEQNIYWMRMAVNIAEHNLEPTISVGCVIVKDEKMISTGYRLTKIIIEQPLIDITYHAEHIAILIAGEKAKRATLYATMEPCTARKPYPGDNAICCCDLIVKSGISKVVYLESDNGFGAGGAACLQAEGIEVIKLTL